MLFSCDVIEPRGFVTVDEIGQHLTHIILWEKRDDLISKEYCSVEELAALQADGGGFGKDRRK